LIGLAEEGDIAFEVPNGGIDLKERHAQSGHETSLPATSEGLRSNFTRG
jgi:hypothetical protein